MVEDIDNFFHAAFHSTFEVGIFNTQEEYAVALMSQTLTDDSAEQVAQMHKACWAWCHTGNFCSFWKISWWIHLFDVLWCCCNVREKQLCQTLMIHVFLSPLSNTFGLVRNSIDLYEKSIFLQILGYHKSYGNKRAFLVLCKEKGKPF